MSFGEGNLRDKVEELRGLVYDLVLRIQTFENITDVAIMDARFYERIERAGIEVER